MLQGVMLTVVVLAAMTAWAVMKRQAGIVSPMAHFILAGAFLWVAKPLSITLTGRWEVIDAAVGTRDDGFLFVVLLVANVGLVGFFLGYATRLGRGLSKRVRIPEITGNRRLITWLGAIVVVLGLAAFVRYQATPFAGVHAQANEGSYFVNQTAYIAYFCYHLWGIALLWWTGLRRRRAGAALAVFFSFLVLYGGWHRAYVFSLLLGLIITEMLRGHRKVGLGLMVTLGLLIPLLLQGFSAIGADRTFIAKALRGREPELFTPEPRPLLDWDYFLSVEPLATMVQIVPSQASFRWGTTYLDIPLDAVPRILWKKKRRLFAPLVGPGVEGEFGRRYSRGATRTTFAELYYQGGWLGVFGGMFLAGIAWRTLYEKARADAQNPYVRVIYAAALSNWMLWLHHGHHLVLMLMYVLIAPVAFGLVVEWVAQRHRGSRAPEALPTAGVPAAAD